MNGAKAPGTLPNAKALELLAKKDALKAQIQALKVKNLATDERICFSKAHPDILFHMKIESGPVLHV